MMKKRYQKVDLAEEQLVTAVQLFLDGKSMVSAFTLAGVAEELFGQEVCHQGRENAIAQLFDKQKDFLEALYKKPVDIRAYRDELNYLKNTTKHFRDPNESYVDADLEDAALWMIVRAYMNRSQLDLPESSLEARFKDWFYEEVVGKS